MAAGHPLHPVAPDLSSKMSGSKCIVLTCEHVVNGFRRSIDRLFIRRFLNTQQIKQLPAILLYVDPSSDITILQVEGLTEHVPSLTFSLTAAAPIGDTAIALGYYNPQGLFSGLVAFADFPAVSPGQVRLCYYAGMSSGAVICRGGVTGVIGSGYHEATFAISTETVHRVLKKWLRIGRNDIRTIQEVIASIQM